MNLIYNQLWSIEQIIPEQQKGEKMKRLKHISILLCLQILICICGLDSIINSAEGARHDLSIDTTEPRIYKMIEKTKEYIISQQNEDGGWSLLPGGESEVEITALAIWALIEADWGTGSRIIRRGVRFLRNSQREDGSWNDNTAHTIFALIALTKANTDPDARFDGITWIQKAQNRSGSWGHKGNSTGQVLYTSATLVGLKYLGFNHISFDSLLPGMEWLESFEQRNREGYWNLPGGTQSDIYVTAWALQGLLPAYDVDTQIAWLKQFQNSDGGFPRFPRKDSDPEVTATVIMALAANEDPLNTRRVAINYLMKAQKSDGSFISKTPREINSPKANLQTTCMVLIAVHSKTDGKP